MQVCILWADSQLQRLAEFCLPAWGSREVPLTPFRTPYSPSVWDSLDLEASQQQATALHHQHAVLHRLIQWVGKRASARSQASAPGPASSTCGGEGLTESGLECSSHLPLKADERCRRETWSWERYRWGQRKGGPFGLVLLSASAIHAGVPKKLLSSPGYRHDTQAQRGGGRSQQLQRALNFPAGFVGLFSVHLGKGSPHFPDMWSAQGPLSRGWSEKQPGLSVCSQR